MQEEIIKVVITAVISNAVAMTILGFLFKSLIGHYLDKDINSYKSALAAENLKLQISYGGIFEKQADAVLALYSKLLELESGAATENLRTPQQWNTYRDILKNTVNFYHEKRVLIPQRLDKKIYETIDTATNIWAHSTESPAPETLAEKFRVAKLETLNEMRNLLSIGANSIS